MLVISSMHPKCLSIIKELMFFSTDEIFDRMGLNPDNFPTFKKYLKTRLPKFDSELGYYVLKTDSRGIPEYGFIMNNEVLIQLVKEYLYRLLQLHIKRAGAYAQIDTVQIKYVYDPLLDLKILQMDGRLLLKKT